MAGTVTALVAQKRNKERVNVYLDGEFAFGLAAIEAIKLRKGQVLSDEEIKRLKAADEIEVAYEKALNFLSYRPRSTQEVRQNLLRSKKGFSEAAVNAAVERLERVGLLDNLAFARFWVSNRDQHKPRSARALRYELRQKGLEDDVIEAVLTDVDESEAAYRAARSRVRRFESAGEEVFRKKMGDFLARRGFSYGVIREVLDRLIEEMAAQQ